jgi:hypothetical protein
VSRATEQDENPVHILGKCLPEGSGVGPRRLSLYGGMCFRSFELVLVQGRQTQHSGWPQICSKRSLRLFGRTPQSLQLFDAEKEQNEIGPVRIARTNLTLV